MQRNAQGSTWSIPTKETEYERYPMQQEMKGRPGHVPLTVIGAFVDLDHIDVDPAAHIKMEARENDPR